MAGSSSERRGTLLILCAALLWSTGGAGIKLIDEPPLVIAFYRCAIAGVVLLAALRPRGWRFSSAFVGAVVCYAGCLITFVVATKWTTAANAIFLQYGGVVWVMLASPIVLGERLRRRDAIAAAVALLGMALFFAEDLSPGDTRGNLVAVLSSLFFAGLVLLLRRERGASAEAAVSWGNVVAAVGLAPFALPDAQVDARSLSILAFLGVFQIGVAYLLFVRGIGMVSAVAATLTGMVEPLANPVWVLMLTGERPHRFAIVGGLIVLGSLAWRSAGLDQRAPQVMPPD